MVQELHVVGGVGFFLLLLISIPFIYSGTSGGGGVDLNSSFLDLNDTPSSYSGQAGKVATVNPSETGLIFADANGSSGDSNQVKVSANDTTPGYLENKIADGKGTQTSVNNEGGNETLSIDLNAGLLDLNGSQSCSAGQALQEVGNATSCISVGSGDGNLLYVLKNPLSSQTITQPNGVQLFINQDGNTSNSTSVGGALNLNNTDNNGAALIIYSNAGSEANGRLLNIRADNTGFDQAVFHVDNDGTANAAEIVNNSTDSSSQALNVVSNNPNDTTLGINGVETSKGTLKIVHNVAGGGDSSASAASFDLQGEGTQAQGLYIDSTSASGTRGDLLRLRNRSVDEFVVDANGNLSVFGNIQFYGTIFGGDFNYSLVDANNAQTASAQHALSSVGNLFAQIYVPTEADIDGNAALFDTNCAGLGSCFFVQYKNKDANLFDVNSLDIFPRGDANSDLGTPTLRFRDAWFSRDVNALRVRALDVNFFGVAGVNKLNVVDFNSTRGTIKDLNVTNDLNVGRNVLVQNDLNIFRDANVARNLSVDTNIDIQDGNLNVLDGCIVFGTGSVKGKLCFTTVDGNATLIWGS